MGYEEGQIRFEIEAGAERGDREEGPGVRTSSEKVERAAMASSTGMAMSPGAAEAAGRRRGRGRGRRRGSGGGVVGSGSGVVVPL